LLIAPALFFCARQETNALTISPVDTACSSVAKFISHTAHGHRGRSIGGLLSITLENHSSPEELLPTLAIVFFIE
jgi:hypothetical protein